MEVIDTITPIHRISVDQFHRMIEAADTSLSVDRDTKLPKYARAGIRRYWVVDIKNRTIHDYRDPAPFGGRYRQLHSVAKGLLSVTIEGVEIHLDVEELFPE